MVVADTVTAGSIYVTNDAGQIVIALGVNDDGNGTVSTYQPNGIGLVGLSATQSGGIIEVLNKVGETIANMYADEYGNGKVGAYNRKGKGRTLKPGP